MFTKYIWFNLGSNLIFFILLFKSLGSVRYFKMFLKDVSYAHIWLKHSKNWNIVKYYFKIAVFYLNTF